MPDYFDDPTVGDRTFQYPKNGDTFLEICCRFVSSSGSVYNYLETPLSRDLEFGHIYRINAHFNLHDYSYASPAEIGVKFTQAYLSCDNPEPGYLFPNLVHIEPDVVLDVRKVDTANWLPCDGLYLSKGGEKYFTIGYFKQDTSQYKRYNPIFPNSTLVDMFIDQVEVFDIPLEVITREIVVCNEKKY